MDEWANSLISLSTNMSSSGRRRRKESPKDIRLHNQVAIVVHFFLYIYREKLKCIPEEESKSLQATPSSVAVEIRNHDNGSAY